MKNKIDNLTDHLFAQLERLNDEDLSGEKLTAEIERSKAVAEVAKQVVAAGSVQVSAMTVMVKAKDAGLDVEKPKLLESKSSE